MSVLAKTEDLEAFITVVDSGSFSAAATLLDWQVARVSRAVSRLEKNLSCSLLNRTTRRLELTEEGLLFIAYARQGLNMLAQGEESLRLLTQRPAGRLRIDAASPFVYHQLTRHIGDFSRAFPAISLELTSHDNIIDLLEFKTDIAIRIGDMQDSNLHARRLGTSPLHLVAAPEYLASAGPLNTIADLAEHRLIGFTDAPRLNQWPLQEALPLSFAICASSGETVRQLCLAGQGIALLSNFMCYEDIAAQRLCRVLPEAVRAGNRRESIHAVYYKNSAVSSRILAFLDFIAPRLCL